MTGNKDGVLSGIPVAPGAFSIVIKYRSGVFSGSSEVILKVLEDYRNKDFIVKSTATKVGLVIEYPKNQIFKVGQAVKIPFFVKNSVGRLVWSFIGLPTESREAHWKAQSMEQLKMQATTTTSKLNAPMEKENPPKPLSLSTFNPKPHKPVIF